MNIDRSKSKLSTIALILLLTISATLVALPSAAALAQSKETVMYLGVMPNPVGKGQMVLLHVGITDYLTSAEMGFEDLIITVTDPEGGVSTLGPIRTDSTGGTGAVFTPDKVGTYKLQGHFPEQTLEIQPFMYPFASNLTYLASDSEIVELVVQEEAIAYYPGHSLPDEYWTRPINSQLREWNKVSSNWPRDPNNLYAPYNEYAPETAHILWTTEMDYLGGLAGGELEGYSYGIGDAYEGKFPSRFILHGRLYYTTGGTSADLPKRYYCIDLHTGEELWSKVFLNNASISFGQVLYWNGINYHGAFAYLYVSVGGGGGFWGPPMPATWHAFDADTGDWRFTIENVPSGTTIIDESNNWIYILSVNQDKGWMALWNATRCCLSKASGYTALGSWGNSVHGQTLDAEANTTAAQAAWEWNVTIPTGLPGSVMAAGLNDRVVGVISSQEEVTVWGLSLEEDDEGDLLFNETWEAPDYWAETNLTVSGMMSGGWVAWSLKEGEQAVVLWAKESREHFAWSTETGKYLWKTETQNYMDNFMDFITRDHNIAYGRLFSVSVSGIIYCYNMTNGEELWRYYADDPYQEFLFGNNWWQKMLFVTDGKLYTTHIEHSPIDPRPRGGPTICLDITDGSVVWRMDGGFRGTHWGGVGIIGDSIIATYNTYDQRVYAIGKGASTTTVTAPDMGVSLGSSVVIRGTVMDVSPGTEDTALQIRFPNGVPAISDESMSEWMKYVYMQFGIPADATGVEVKLEAIDPNGEYAYIGTATTDTSGNYGFTFKPDVEGKYLIMATFYGSGGYYASTTTTYLAVDPAPEELDIPSAEEIAQETISQLPAYPDVPSATEVAQETISQLPAYPEIPAYLTIDLAIIAAVAIAIIIGLYSIIKKQK